MRLANGLRRIQFHSIPVRRNRDHEPYQLDWTGRRKPDFAGVYAFWWHQGRDHLMQTIQNFVVAFHGPGGISAKDKLLTITAEHFTEFDGRVPLYIGKAHCGKKACIAQRVGQHLLLKTRRAVPISEGHQRRKRMTTSCQLRDRLDRLFDEREDPRNLILENVALSYVEFRPEDWVGRFYLEYLAIGLFRPLFNLDCER